MITMNVHNFYMNSKENKTAKFSWQMLISLSAYIIKRARTEI